MWKRRNAEPSDRGSGLVVGDSPAKSNPWRRWANYMRGVALPETRTQELDHEAYSDPEDDETERTLIEHEENTNCD